MTFKAACIQNCATPDIHHDIGVLTRLIEEAAGQLLLTSLAPRACPFVRLRTGVNGTVEVKTTGGRTERVIHPS